MSFLLCVNCNVYFEREQFEINRCVRQGQTNFFCTKSCNAKFHNSKRNQLGYSTKNKTINRKCLRCLYDREFSIHSKKSTPCKKCNAEIILDEQINVAISCLKNKEQNSFKRKIKLENKVKYIKINKKKLKCCITCNDLVIKCGLVQIFLIKKLI